MKIICTVSGGKDSTAALIWTIKEFCGGKTDNLIPVFCDTGFENKITYEYLDYLEQQLNIKIVRLRSAKFDGFLDMVKKKGRFPSTKARFCTEELKVKPMIDFILDNVKDDILVIQGIRADESKNRSLMQKYCRYFKGYFEKKFKYRKKEVFAFCKSYADEVLRPIIEWDTQQVFQYLKDNGIKKNELYDAGFKRVGCFPCIMATKPEIKLIAQKFISDLESLREKEIENNSTFFPPNYLPKPFCSIIKTNSKGKEVGIPTIEDVIKYVKSKTYGKNRKSKTQTENLFLKSCKNEIVSCHF